MSQFSAIDISSLRIIKYPDPRLRQQCWKVVDFDDHLRVLAARMFELMYQANGVGLAASQVGVTACFFVANPTLEPQDERVYVNPQLINPEGAEEAEEGCLSLPNVTAKIKRFARITIKAQNLNGETFEEPGEELLARIFQHEKDHLDGLLLVDKMSAVAKLANRRTLKELEADFTA